MSMNRYCHCSRLMNKLAVIIGGYNGSASLSHCEMLDISTSQWMKLPDLSIPRYLVSCASTGNLIYVVGGSDGLLSYHSSTEWLDIRSTTRGWQPGIPLPSKRYGHQCHSLNGMIYCIGGHDESHSLSTVLQLDLIKGVWESLPDMKKARGYFGSCSQ